MVRALLKPILPLMLLFTTVIGLVYALPGEDDNLLESLIVPPDGCRAPCWQGIQPGVTPVNEAIERLEANPWIDHLIITESFGATHNGFIGWVWSGQQPAPIDGRLRGAMWVSYDVVQSVRIPTTIPFGALWLRFHRPAQGSFHLALDAHAMDYVVLHIAVYRDYKFVAWSEVSCPLSPASFWSAPMYIQFTNTASTELADYRLPGWAFESPCG